MKTLSNPKNEDSKETGSKGIDKTDRIVKPIDLSSDPEYTKLLELYQHADFVKCREVLERIEKRYPEHPHLLKFKDDLQVKLSLKNMAISTEKEEKNNKKKAMLKKIVFAVITTLIAMGIYFLVYTLINNNIAAKQLEEETVYLASLENQAEQLLLSEQPQPAAEIIERIRSINPEFINLPELTSSVENLLRLEANYQTALNLMAENKNNEALVILNEIEAEKPGLWEVNQQIDKIETSFQVAAYIKEGNAAYLIENWDQVVSSYENALSLDPELDDLLVSEQLLKGYLNSIISMVENKNTSIEDIEKAEEYYRKAVGMTSQSKAFASERENLQNANANLLKLKYTLIAKANLEDKSQTVTSVDNAVSYMKKAVNIDPENTDLKLELENAETYQIGFNNFIKMNWEHAIINLEYISSKNQNYANGNAKLLLYEAYYAQGKQYSSFGLYLDAIKSFEQAEILAWFDSSNRMKLFQVQATLGDTLGKINDYENAVSYYKYALNAIQDKENLPNFSTIAAKIADANNLADARKFEDANKAFQDVLKDIDTVYTISEIEISDGVCLALFANENLSTMDAILIENNLPAITTVTFGQKLRVPTIE